MYQQPPHQGQPPLQKRPSGWLIAALVLLGLLVAGGIIGALVKVVRSQNTTSHVQPAHTLAPTDTPPPGIAFHLASIDSHSTISASDPIIGTYQAVLDTLHRKTGDSEQTIAAETLKGQQMLHKKGIDLSLLDLLNTVNNAIPEHAHIHYADALDALIASMENPQN